MEDLSCYFDNYPTTSYIQHTIHFTLQALFECLGILFNKLDLKDPISLNWVRFRPGIWDSGAISSTGSCTCERRPTHGCLGFTPKRGSKQCGIDILPIFLLRFGSNLWMWMASFASWVTWDPCQLCLRSKVMVMGGDGQYSVSIWQR